MYLFKPWKPKSKKLFNRIYVDGMNKVFLEKRGGIVQLVGSDSVESNQLLVFLLSRNIKIHEMTLAEIIMAMEENDLIFKYGCVAKKNQIQEMLTDDDYYEQSKQVDMSSIKYLKKTINDVHVIVDNREPDQLLELLASSQLESVFKSDLKSGDVLVRSKSNPNKQILFERKRILDSRQSIISAHSHGQCERYFELREDTEVKVVKCV